MKENVLVKYINLVFNPDVSDLVTKTRFERGKVVRLIWDLIMRKWNQDKIRHLGQQGSHFLVKISALGKSKQYLLWKTIDIMAEQIPRSTSLLLWHLSRVH